ncbi:MAG: lipase family protein [Pseudomonadota bacterium]
MFRYFRHTATGHSATNAYLCSVLAYHVYHQPSLVNGNWHDAFNGLLQTLSVPGDPFTLDTIDVPTDPEMYATDTQAAVIANSDVIFVVFRGTASSTDWLNDLQHGLMALPFTEGGLPPGPLPPINGPHVHVGFWRALDTRYDDIRARVLTRRTQNQRIFVTGHSLGGALAILCAYRLNRDPFLAVQGVYTFGSPRVGDPAFRDAYGSTLGNRTHRWIYNQEFAAALPTLGPLGYGAFQPHPYAHLGRENFIAADGSVTMNRSYADPTVGAAWLIGVLPGLNADDHDLTRTCRRLRWRLSRRTRTSATNPSWLVRKDPAHAMSIF